MRNKLIACGLTLLLCGYVYAQSNNVKELCRQALSFAQANAFEDALKSYDKAINLIQQQTPDNAIYIEDSLLEYIITGLAKDNLSTSRKYVQDILKLRLDCIQFLSDQDYFDSPGDFIENISNVYQNIGLLYAEVGLLDDAEYCLNKAIDVYEKKDASSLEGYPNSLELLGQFYLTYRNDPVSSLASKFRALNSLVSQQGGISTKVRQLFGRILTDYALDNAYYSLAGEEGVIQHFPDLPVYSFEQIKSLAAEWDISCRTFDRQLAPGASDKLVSSNPISFGGDQTVIVGSPGYGELCVSLAAIHHNLMKDYEIVSDTMLNKLSSAEEKIAYSKFIIASLRNHNYINQAAFFYRHLSDILMEDSQEALAEQIRFEGVSMLYSYGQYQDVWDYFNPLLPAIVDESVSPKYPNLFVQQLTLLGMLYDRQKQDSDHAIELLGKAITVAESYNDVDRSLLPVLYNNIGTVYYHKGEYDKSIVYIQEALDSRRNWLHENGFTDEDVWIALYTGNLADEYARKGDYDSAERHYLYCLDFYQRLYPNRGKEIMHLLDGLISVYQGQGKTDKVRENVELFSSIQLKTFLQEAQGMTKRQRADLLGGLDNGTMEIVSQFALDNPDLSDLAYNAALIHKGFSISYEMWMRDNVLKADDSELKKAYAAFKDAESHSDPSVYEKEKALVYLYSQHKEFLDEFPGRTWKDIQSALTKKDIAIEFVTCCSDAGATVFTAAILLRKDWDSPKIVNLGDAKQFNAVLKNTPRVYRDNDALYALVWDKITPYLKGVNTIYLSPHGALSQINIEVLENPKGKPMNQVYDVYRLSSTGNICESTHERYLSDATLYGGLYYDTSVEEMARISRSFIDYSIPDERVAPIIDATRKGWKYLPGTEKEISQISDILTLSKRTCHIFSKNDGTEEAFKSLSGKSPSIIHLATHGFYYTKQEATRNSYSLTLEDDDFHSYPLRRCGLILSGAQHSWLGEQIPEDIEDGILTGQEIAGLNLTNTELVVLSACQTGLGDITGEGVYGLQHAFKVAGVGTIIMSLWEVSDAATELMMTKFYSALASGKSKRDSFDSAIAAVKKEFEWPEYWAAFIMLD